MGEYEQQVDPETGDVLVPPAEETPEEDDQQKYDGGEIPRHEPSDEDA